MLYTIRHSDEVLVDGVEARNCYVDRPLRRPNHGMDGLGGFRRSIALKDLPLYICLFAEYIYVSADHRYIYRDTKSLLWESEEHLMKRVLNMITG